mgnify:CR=1 FL=1
MGNRNRKRRPMIRKLEGFFERLEVIVGTSVYEKIKDTFTVRPTTFRVNTLKASRHEVMMELSKNGFKVEQIVWYKDAFILKNKSKRELSNLSIYTEGKIYIQSLASMVPPLEMELEPGDVVLDLTAAPGSKTSQIAALLQRKGELVANDVDKIRFLKLEHNMYHLGVAALEDDTDWNFTLKLGQGRHLVKEYDNYFDKILLDAPCSAEARFDLNNSKTYSFWSERKVRDMAYQQRTLLLGAWQALKPGGILVYSTCTMAPEENEIQVSRLLDRFDDAKICTIMVPLKKIPPVLEWKELVLNKKIKKSLRVYPTNQIEGFFIAKIKKINHSK